MKFSTVTASAVLFGSMVIAMPANVVYETEVVTITSCAPEVTDCPYASKTVDTKPQTTTTPCSTSTPEVKYEPEHTTTEVKYEPEYTTTEVKYEPEHTPCTTSTEVKYEPEHHTTPTPYPEPTYPVTTVHPEVKSSTPCPESTYTPPPPVTYPNTTTPVCPGGYGCEKPTYVPHCPGGYDCPPIPSGVPHPPANTSSPSYPTPPPVTNEGGANKLVGSLVAVMGVAVLALFA